MATATLARKQRKASKATSLTETNDQVLARLTQQSDRLHVRGDELQAALAPSRAASHADGLAAQLQAVMRRVSDLRTKAGYMRRLADRELHTTQEQLAETEKAKQAMPKLRSELHAVEEERNSLREQIEFHRTKEQSLPETSRAAQELIAGNSEYGAEQDALRSELANVQQQQAVTTEAIRAVQKRLDLTKAARHRERLRDDFLPEHRELFARYHGAIRELIDVVRAEQALQGRCGGFASPLQPFRNAPLEALLTVVIARLDELGRHPDYS